MGGMQTILALLAVTLFSSMTLGSFNNMTEQSTLVYASYLNILGQDNANSFFEKLNCLIIAKKKTIADIYHDYHNKTNKPDLSITDLTNGSTFVNFTSHTDTEYCTVSGAHSGTATDYVKVKLYMSATYGSRTIYVGTSSNPIVRVYTSSGL